MGRSYPKFCEYYGVWYLLLTHHKDEMEHAIRLVHINLTHTVHASDCQRKFSMQNLTKTCVRSRLTDEHCSQIMCVITEGGRIEDFDFYHALEHWREKNQHVKYLLNKTV